MLEHESELLGVNQITSRFSQGQLVGMGLGFSQTLDCVNPNKVTVGEPFENIEHGIHLASPRSPDACAFGSPPGSRKLVLLNQYVEGSPDGTEGDASRYFFRCGGNKFLQATRYRKRFPVGRRTLGRSDGGTPSGGKGSSYGCERLGRALSLRLRQIRFARPGWTRRLKALAF